MKRIRGYILLLAAAIILFSCDIFSIIFPVPRTYTIDFEDETFGCLEQEEGEWEIVSLDDGNRVACPQGTQFVSDMYFRKELGDDFTLSMDFNLVTLQHEHIPNLGFYCGEEYINLLVVEGTLKLHTGADPDNYTEGKESVLALSLQTWYTLEVCVSNGCDFKILLDENEIMAHSFTESHEFDAVSFWGYPSIAEIWIDNIIINVEP